MSYSRPLQWSLVPAGHAAPMILLLHGYRQDRNFSLEAWHALQGRAHLLLAEGPCVHEWGQPRRIGYAWYVYDGDREKLADEMALTSQALDVAITQAALQVEMTDLWAAGFSQGAYMALYYALAHNRAVTRVQAVAGNFNVHKAFANLKGKTVLLEHGQHDEGCPVERMEQLESLLKSRGATVKRVLHQCGHVFLPEMRDTLLSR